MTASRQVSWWAVHEFVAPKLEQVGDWPAAGTPEWCALENRNPVKWAAVLDAAQHWALRIDTEQEARAQAAKDIAAGENWAAIATSGLRREQFYNAKPWLRRAAS